MSKTESIQYMSEAEIFESAKATAEGFTQKEMAEYLECSQPAVSQMLNGDSNMLGLAVKWLEMRIPILDWSIETRHGKPVRYYKAVQVLDE